MTRTYLIVATLCCWSACAVDTSPQALPKPDMLAWDDSANVSVEGSLSTLAVECDLALTPNERAKGLMYRRTPLGPEKGMLFIMDANEDHGFWMKNTYIPLDMIFITEDSVVAGIVQNAEPLTRTSRKCGSPSRYVLEVDAGTCKRHGISVGSTVRFDLENRE